MSNELATLERPEFVAQRVTSRKTKNGPVEVVKSRGLLGVVMSGNKAEHAAGSVELATQLWLDHKYGQIISEYKRVFPTLEKDIERRNVALKEFMAGNPDVEVKVKAIDMGAINKQTTLAIIAVALRKVDPDKAVGERLLCHKIGTGIVAAEKALQEVLAAKKAIAAPAPQ